MIAYLHKTKEGFELTIMQRPDNNAAFSSAEKIKVQGKREANTICKSRNVKPYNF